MLERFQPSIVWVHPSEAPTFIGDRRRSLTDVVAVVVGAPLPGEYPTAFAVREHFAAPSPDEPLPLPVELTTEEAAAAEAARSAAANADVALRIRRDPGEPVIAGEDQPCFFWRVADADPRRVWLLEFE